MHFLQITLVKNLTFFHTVFANARFLRYRITTENAGEFMNDWIDIKSDANHIKRERERARELRNSDWWKNLLGKGECYYCRQKFAPEDLTMDHIVPVARGGKSTRGNIVPCCKECNNRKKYLTPAEMIMFELEAKEKAAQKASEEE